MSGEEKAQSLTSSLIQGTAQVDKQPPNYILIHEKMGVLRDTLLSFDDLICELRGEGIDDCKMPTEPPPTFTYVMDQTPMELDDAIARLRDRISQLRGMLL